MRLILTIKSFIFFFTIIILFCQNIYADESIFYCEQTDGSKFYYDKNNIVNKSGKVRIWNSVILSDLGRAYLIKNIDTNGINPYKIITYNEIDCKQKNFRILSVIFCGEHTSHLKMMDDPKRLFIQKELVWQNWTVA
jgi:hypothetical protein